MKKFKMLKPILMFSVVILCLIACDKNNQNKSSWTNERVYDTYTNQKSIEVESQLEPDIKSKNDPTRGKSGHYIELLNLTISSVENFNGYVRVGKTYLHRGELDGFEILYNSGLDELLRQWGHIILETANSKNDTIQILNKKLTRYLSIIQKRVYPQIRQDHIVVLRGNLFDRVSCYSPTYTTLILDRNTRTFRSKTDAIQFVMDRIREVSGSGINGWDLVRYKFKKLIGHVYYNEYRLGIVTRHKLTLTHNIKSEKDEEACGKFNYKISLQEYIKWNGNTIERKFSKSAFIR